MRHPVLLLAILGSSAQAQVTPSTPITVVAHPWAPFISPMGEPFRARNASDDTLADWFNQADGNHDGALTLDEMLADANRFFAKLDTDHDGQIDPDELAHYEYDIAPDIQVMSRTKRVPGQPAPAPRAAEADPDDPLAAAPRNRESRRQLGEDVDTSLGIGGALQGAARYGLLNMPEPVAAADFDFNRAISLEEFRKAAVERFQLIDKAHKGRVTLAELEALPHAPPDAHQKHRENVADTRIGNPLPTRP